MITVDFPVGEQYIYSDSKLLVPVGYFAEPDKTSLWAVWAEQHAQYI